MSSNFDARAAFAAVQSVIRVIQQIVEHEQDRLSVVLDPTTSGARAEIHKTRQKQLGELVKASERAHAILVPGYLQDWEASEKFDSAVTTSGALQTWEAAFARQWQSRQVAEWAEPNAAWAGPETNLAEMEPIIQAKLDEAHREPALRKVAQRTAAEVFTERLEPLQVCLVNVKVLSKKLRKKAKRRPAIRGRVLSTGGNGDMKKMTFETGGFVLGRQFFRLAGINRELLEAFSKAQRHILSLRTVCKVGPTTISNERGYARISELRKALIKSMDLPAECSPITTLPNEAAWQLTLPELPLKPKKSRR